MRRFVLLFSLFMFLGVGNVFALDVTLSWDSNSDASYYKVYWGETSGNYTDEVDEKIPAETTTYQVKDLENKKWFFAVKAFNDCGNASDFSDEVSNTVSTADPINPPIAVAGQDISINETTPVTLDGSGSSDTDGNIKSYLWTQTSGDTITGLTGFETAKLTFTAPEVTANISVEFTLKVTDSDNLVDTDTCVVTVLDVPNQPPQADAGDNLNVEEGTIVTLTGDNSTDIDGTIVGYAWTQTTGSDLTLTGADSATMSFTAPDISANTPIEFSLAVTDNNGLTGTDNCTVTVLDTETAQVPPIASAGEMISTVSGNSVTLDGSGSEDQDGDITRWQWEQTGGPTITLAGGDTANPSFTAPGVTIKGEKLIFSLTVEDNTGQTNSDSCTVFVSRSLTLYTATGEPPAAPLSLIVEVNDKPSIEVFDKDFNHYAWLKTGWDDYNNANGEARVVTGDIDGDGLDEVVIGLGPVPGISGVPGGYFQILDDDYTHMMWGRINWDEYNEINGETWPACGDIDGDGIDEIVVGLGQGGEGAIEIFELTDGKLYHYDWALVDWQEYNTVLGETRPVCGDIDGDDRDEIVVGLGKIGTFFDGVQVSFEVIDDDLGHLSWAVAGWPEYNAQNGETWPSSGDLYGDGIDDIVMGFGTGGKGQIEAFEFLDGAVVHVNWAEVNWPEYNLLSGETRPVFANVDDDIMEEVIVGLGPVDSQEQIPGGLLQVFDDDFSLIRSEKISWTDFNAVNGESRPVRSSLKNEGKILIGLGSYELGETTGGISEPLETESKAAASEPGSSGSGCFILTLP